MAVSPYPRYWAEKTGKTTYRGKVQLVEGGPIEWASADRKTKGEAMAAILQQVPRICVCGCGEPTKGGEFRMGHDARHKSALIKEALAGGNDDALAEIERRGWLSHLDKAREVAARPKAEPKQVRLDREETDEEKARKALDRVHILKAAGAVLKGLGQYTRESGVQIRMDGVDEAILILEGVHPDLTGEVGPAHWRTLTDQQIGACQRMRERFVDGDPFTIWLDRQLVEEES